MSINSLLAVLWLGDDKEITRVPILRLIVQPWARRFQKSLIVSRITTQEGRAPLADEWFRRAFITCYTRRPLYSCNFCYKHQPRRSTIQRESAGTVPWWLELGPELNCKLSAEAGQCSGEAQHCGLTSPRLLSSRQWPAVAWPEITIYEVLTVPRRRGLAGDRGSSLPPFHQLAQMTWPAQNVSGSAAPESDSSAAAGGAAWNEFTF